jgi:hypothetical protein
MLIKMCVNEVYIVGIGKHLPYPFPTKNGFKQADASSPLLFKFTLEYTIKKVQENQTGIKLKGA